MTPLNAPSWHGHYDHNTTILILYVPCIVHKLIYITLHAPQYTHLMILSTALGLIPAQLLLYP